MNILYVTSDPIEYNSSANMRNIAIIKGLIENGHEVSTLSADFNEKSIYIDNRKLEINLHERYWIKDNINISKNDKNIKLRKIIKSILYKIYILFSIYDPKKRLVKKTDTIKFKERFDVVISSSDPKSAHLLAEKIIKENPNITKKWIQYWGDPLADDINNNKLIPFRNMAKEEKRLIALCDKVVYVSPFTLKRQQNLYPEYKGKMISLPIPYMKREFFESEANEKIQLGYFGDYYSKNRNILPIYNAIKETTDKTLIICGNSDYKLKREKNIIIKERQKLNVIKELEKKSDILVCICNKRGTQIPGKIYHYAATNRPILVLLDGEKKEDIKEYLKDFKRYIFADNDKESIIKALKNIKLDKIQYQNFTAFDPRKIAEEFMNDI